jgi:tripartite-type tricarboxylate transporter receptor subunit TctC
MIAWVFAALSFSKDALPKDALSKGALSKGALSKGALSKDALPRLSLSRFWLSKFSLAVLSLAALSLCPGSGPRAQTFPDKPVRIVVPYGAGGGTDQLARLLAERLSNRWGKSVTVENKAGADGVIGTDSVGKSAPDGHTLALVVGSHTVNAFFNKSMPFDPVKDFVPISLVAYSPIAMVVTPQMGVNTAQELVARLKANEGKNTYGSSEKVTRLSGELFSQETGGKMTYVPYKGGAQLMGPSSSIIGPASSRCSR